MRNAAAETGLRWRPVVLIVMVMLSAAAILAGAFRYSERKKNNPMQLSRLVVGPLQVNCYIVYDEKTNEAIVIDPGDDAQD
ncbi:MAG: MBL fold metallo-hydrolase, partial [Methylococcaceae bacterium]|nr:MBL fold metallo-hydrolase [Methylococcaceae bacterium]